MFEIIAVTGLLWWAMIGVVFVTMLVALEKESYGWLWGIGIITLLAHEFLSDFSPIGYIVANPMTIVYGVIGYLVVGMNWGFVKWWFFTRAAATAYREARDRKYPNMPAGEMLTPEQRERLFNDFVIPSKYVPILTDRRVSNYKTRIITWVTYWPISMFWTLLNDPIKMLVKFLYHRVIKAGMIAITQMNINGSMAEELYGSVEDDHNKK